MCASVAGQSGAQSGGRGSKKKKKTFLLGADESVKIGSDSGSSPQITLEISPLPPHSTHLIHLHSDICHTMHPLQSQFSRFFAYFGRFFALLFHSRITKSTFLHNNQQNMRMRNRWKVDWVLDCSTPSGNSLKVARNSPNFSPFPCNQAVCSCT